MKNPPLTATPDKNVFPDIDSYNDQCTKMYEKLYGNDGYALYTAGGEKELVKTIGSWDYKTATRIGWVTSSYVISDLFEAAKEIF